MRFSVVINTYNRAQSLRTTLDALCHQHHTDFEVVVVNGPSDDGTAKLLAERADALRVVDCPQRNLAVSRNLGIDAAAGEVVAFIDDDAVPEARWLSGLAAAYDSGHVGGAGGLVLDHTGVRPQYRYSVCDRIGRTDFDSTPPFVAENEAGADPFVYLQGTNCSFRRSALEAIEGFDEEIEYNFDEVEVCARVIDSGLRLRALGNAVVHHKFLPSHMRHERGFSDPYFGIKNRVYFALRVGSGHRPLREALETLTGHLAEQKAHMASEVRQGNYTKAEAEHYVARAEAGFELGLERGLAGVRKGREIAPADPSAFRPYPVRVAEGRRVAVCFVSLDYPPRPLGGVGRYTHDLARGLALAGHEAHVVTRDDEGPYRLDFEEGVWVHRFPVAERWIPELDGQPLKGLLDHHAAVRAAVDRATERIPFDAVTGSSWVAEPLLCAYEATLPLNVVCVTPLRTIAEYQPATAAAPLTAPQIAAEDALLRSGARLQPISSEVAELAGASPDDVVWLGTADHRADHPRARSATDETVEILYVGRLERRKGIDALLEAAAGLLRERPHARLRLVGADNPGANGGEDVWPAWVREHAADVADRIVFDGALDDAGLLQAYADCDVFCAPSRYESFGLVHVEAMMMGRPVVGADVGGMRATIVDSATGLLPAAGDVDALRAALVRLVDDAGERERMGAAGRARYEAEFGLSVAVERHVERFRALAAAPASEPRPLAPLLADLTGIDDESAAAAARALLDPGRFPHDLEGEVRRALAQPDPGDLVREAFSALLHRPARPAEVGAFAERIRAGESALAIVADIATSDEARGTGLDLRFLERLPRRDPALLRRQITEVWLRDDDASFVAGVRALLDTAAPFGGDRRAWIEEVLRDPALGAVVASSWLDGLRTESEILAGLRGAGSGGTLVEAAYRLLLGRDPDPDAGGWAQSEPAALVRGIGGSGEARARGISPDVVGRLAHAVAGPRGRLRRRLRSAVASDRALRETHADLVDRLHSLERAVPSPATPPAPSLTPPDPREAAAAGLYERALSERETVAGAVAALADRLDVLATKQAALALDVREKLPSAALVSAPEPHIVDPAALASRIQALGGVRLNLGCGEKPLDDYLNIDARNLPGVDVVADVSRLPFEPGTVAEIASHHLIEHFRQHQVATVLLPYWRSLLGPGGRLRVVTPNWAALIDDLQEGRLSFADFKEVTFGAQDYEGDDHFALYWPEALVGMLERAGFGEAEVVVERRQNGLSPEMEVVATASVGSRVT